MAFFFPSAGAGMARYRRALSVVENSRMDGMVSTRERRKDGAPGQIRSINVSQMQVPTLRDQFPLPISSGMVTPKIGEEPSAFTRSEAKGIATKTDDAIAAANIQT